MTNIQSITQQVTECIYRDIHDVLSHSAVIEDEWSSEDAKAECDAIIESMLEGLSASDDPKITIISGIPYSGKSTYIQHHHDDFRNTLFIAFDAIMKQLSLYKKLMPIDSALAFAKCELVARVAGYELLRQAAERKLNIVFEHSSTPMPHVTLYKHFVDDLGYKLDFVYMDCTLELAQQRAQQENTERDDGRFTPSHFIEGRYHALQQMLSIYEQNFNVIKVK